MFIIITIIIYLFFIFFFTINIHIHICISCYGTKSLQPGLGPPVTRSRLRRLGTTSEKSTFLFFGSFLDIFPPFLDLGTPLKWKISPRRIFWSWFHQISTDFWYLLTTICKLYEYQKRTEWVCHPFNDRAHVMYWFTISLFV